MLKTIIRQGILNRKGKPYKKRYTPVDRYRKLLIKSGMQFTEEVKQIKDFPKVHLSGKNDEPVTVFRVGDNKNEDKSN